MPSSGDSETPTVAEPRSATTGPRPDLSADASALDSLDEPPASWLAGLAGLEGLEGLALEQPHEPGASGPDGPPDTLAADGLESQVLLGRARSRLLGWDETPVKIGRYRILEQLGAGGMGVVYAAQDDELDRAVAIKILRRDLAPGSAGRQRLLREAQATAKLSHPNVVHVYEVGQAGDQVYMAMELVRGVTLRAWRKAEPRSWREVLEMFLRAGEGLVAAHAEGIVHRDFKPDNVLVDPLGRPQIVDFGLARATHNSSASGVWDDTTRTTEPATSGSRLRDFDITRTGIVVGTPAYMAPEQLARAEPDARSDQFSFCASVFEALYGTRPFSGSTYTELEQNLTSGRPVHVRRRGDVPRAIHAAVLRGLARDPSDRFVTMRALLDALAAGRTTRRPWRWGLAVVASSGLALAAAIALDREDPPLDTTVPANVDTPTTDPWAAVVDAAGLPALVPTPLAGDPAQVTVHRLRNGLTVYVASRPQEPVVAAALVIRAGRAQEPLAAPGLSGLTTAVILNGTERLGALAPAAERGLRVFEHALLEQLADVDDPSGRAREAIITMVAAAEQAGLATTVDNELFAAVTALGGRDPLVIGHDGPIIVAEVPRHRLGAWMQLHAEAVMRPVFRDFLRTVAQRLESIGFAGGGDEGSRKLRHVLGEATGLRSDLAVTVAALERLPLAEVRSFHDQFWRPNNAALVLVGDISSAEALSLAEQAFGAWEPAALATVEPVDQPIANGRVVIEVEDVGPPHLSLAWPMPPTDTPEYDALEILSSVVGGRGGLLRSAMREKVGGWGSHIGSFRDFNVFIMLKPGQSATVAEDATLEGLRAIAEDRVDAGAWPNALASAQFEQLAWARGPGSLMQHIARSFLARRAWSTGSGSPAAPAPTRPQMVAAAQSLLARGHVALHQRTGKATRLTVPSLPIPVRPPARPQQSAFVSTLLAAPTASTEPRFLIEGSHYETSKHGAGRVITVKTDSPLFHLSWIYPVGTAEDPFSCEALRGRMRLLQISGADLSVFCNTTDSRYEITAAADRFAELMPALLAWFAAGTMDPETAKKYVENLVSMRIDARAQPFVHATAVEFYGLLGDHALDTQLPSDAEHRRHGASSILAAFSRLSQYDADVLYAGPDPEALRAALPPPTGKTFGKAHARVYRQPPKAEVLFIHDPNLETVTVRASVPWIATTPRAHLAAAMHRGLVLEAERAAAFSADFDALGYAVPFSPGPPIAIGLGFQVAPEALAGAIEAALTGLRARPTPDNFATARAQLETAFRADRTAPWRIPELVYAWGPDTPDPRVAQWLALPSLGYDDVMEYYATIDALIPVVVVSGNAERVDFDAVQRFGEIVHIDPANVMRDQSFSGFGRNLPLLIDE